MRRFAVKKWIRKIKQWWRSRQFRQANPIVAERRDYLKQAIKQGNKNPVSRAKRGRYA